VRPTDQELFYNWTLTILPNHDLKDFTVVLRDSLPLSDRVLLKAGSGSASESTPQWKSGTSRSTNPDYYTRTIHITEATKKNGISIVLNRPTQRLQLPSEAEFSRSFEVQAAGCEVEYHGMDAHQEAAKIFRRVGIMAAWQYLGKDQPALPMKSDAGYRISPLGPAEAEVTMEARCPDDSCDHLIMRQMGSRRPPL
jgi:hypothetical protein